MITKQQVFPCDAICLSPSFSTSLSLSLPLLLITKQQVFPCVAICLSPSFSTSPSLFYCYLREVVAAAARRGVLPAAARSRLPDPDRSFPTVIPLPPACSPPPLLSPPHPHSSPLPRDIGWLDPASPPLSASVAHALTPRTGVERAGPIYHAMCADVCRGARESPFLSLK